MGIIEDILKNIAAGGAEVGAVGGLMLINFDKFEGVVLKVGEGFDEDRFDVAGFISLEFDDGFVRWDST